MFGNSHTLFRPPAEADSLIIRVADGCPWNGCTFCGMYKGVPYKFHGTEDAEREFAKAAKRWPDARRIFLADGDVMNLDFHPSEAREAPRMRGNDQRERQTLETMLVSLNEKFRHLARVSVYANGASILAKTDDELHRLKELKLHTLYMGLESGDNETLRAVNKRESAEEMIVAGQRAQAAGLRMSVMILIGLAGELRSMQHAQETARAVNAMQPRLLSALRLIPVPGTPLHDAPGEVTRPTNTDRKNCRPSDPTRRSFQMLTQFDAVVELREMIQGLELEQTVFRADHSSNIVPLEARFPKDKERLLRQLDALLSSGHLDCHSPGVLPLLL